MNFNDKVFFDKVRQAVFGGTLSPEQVNGLNLILTTWKVRYVERTPIAQLAYVFATTTWETARRMQPIEEYGKGKGRKYGVPDPRTGKVYFGRGYVQLTWYDNYLKATKQLRARGYAVDFVMHPEDVMRPEYAVVILFEGMEEGWFTGKSLDGTIDTRIDGDEHADFVTGRGIINGRDKAEEIARIADAYLLALRAATA